MSKTGYPFEVQIEVAFRDIDAFGHVNNAVFFSYMEYGRVKYAMKLFEGTVLQTEGLLDIPLILVEATCTYRSPAFLGETLTLGIGLSRFGRTSFDLVYRFVGQDGRLVAHGKTIQVMYDYVANSPFPIPAAVHTRVDALQGGWGFEDA